MFRRTPVNQLKIRPVPNTRRYNTANTPYDPKSTRRSRTDADSPLRRIHRAIIHGSHLHNMAAPNITCNIIPYALYIVDAHNGNCIRMLNSAIFGSFCPVITISCNFSINDSLEGVEIAIVFCELLHFTPIFGKHSNSERDGTVHPAAALFRRARTLPRRPLTSFARFSSFSSFA